MKRSSVLFHLTLAVGLAPILAACGGGDTPPEPSVPTNVTATPQEDGSVLVAWEHEGEDPDAFVVYRDALDDGLALQAPRRVAEVEGDARAYVDTNVVVGERAVYQIASRIGDAESAVGSAAAPVRVPPAFEVLVGTDLIDRPDFPEPVTVFLFLVHDEAAMPAEPFEVVVSGPDAWNGGEDEAFEAVPEAFMDGIALYYSIAIPVVSGTYTVRATLDGTEYVTTSRVDATRTLAPAEVVVDASGPEAVDASWNVVTGAASYQVLLMTDEGVLAMQRTAETRASFTDLDLGPGEYTVRVYAETLELPQAGAPPRPYPQYDLSVAFADPFVIPLDGGIFHAVDSQGTYLLRAEGDLTPDGTAPDATALDLAADLSVSPGQCLGLMRSGHYSPRVVEPGPLPDLSTSMIAVFAGSDGFVEPGPGGNQDDVVSRMNDDGADTDIAEDFAVPGLLRIVEVPVGATEILLGPNDSFFGDNGDPNDDYGVTVGIVPCP